MTTKHTFIRANGVIIQCESFMQSPTLMQGYEWRNTAEKQWVEQPQQPSIDVNDTRIFGYEQQDFLLRQYK